MQNAGKASRGAPRSRLTRPSRQILADGAYEALKAMIMDHQLEPGERLNIEELARRLEVSATPVREALARLESDGLVGKRALSGYTAAPLLNMASLGHLFEIRHLLEPHAATKAASLATEADVAALDQMAASMQVDDIGATYDHYRSFAAHDAEFHALIARISGNPVLEQTLVGLHFHWHLYRLRFETAVGVDTIAEHVRIVEAIKSRDPAAASMAMSQHLIESQKRLIPVVAEDPAETD